MSSSADFFRKNYTVILDQPLTGRIVRLPADAQQICCRFCKRSSQDASFRRRAHAVPELLGNQALFSPNECDECNSLFGRNYENDLGAGTLFERSVTGVPGKRGKPAYAESKELRIEWVEGRQTITVTDAALFRQVSKTGEIRLKDYKLKAYSQPFVPRNAAMALVKAACSLCPPDVVEQVQPTIAWLLDPSIARLNPFWVFHCSPDGDNPYGFGRALLLKRTGTQPMPFLQCIIASGRDRFEYSVPFTTEDSQWIASQFAVSDCKITQSGTGKYQTYYYPDWTDSAEVEHDRWDWSSDATTRRVFDVTMNVIGQVESTE